MSMSSLGPDSSSIPANVDIPSHVRRHLGSELQAYYVVTRDGGLPPRLAHLVERLEAAVASTGVGGGDWLDDDLIQAVPALRGFAFSLIGDATRADDLVQETLVKAWSSRKRFMQGTNMNAWLFTILRNQFYTEMRKAKREVEDADGNHAGKLTALPDQGGVVNLRRLRETLDRIPEAQRSALLLVGAEGYIYEEAAERLQCAVGTVKSRVSRARAYLSQTLGLSGLNNANVAA
ncbi:sigma-70 family RNA polymerase sigma factor [Methylobacterium sp. WL120]|uniref:sigma-70 family RNA polymerase sigma factor n=1 Tax=Methylobacterium sp. WL120 TaxID=2603887 RepID=UPI0011CC238D|nr:sigma-70 family RNA polymerase sigma factor [Methylobacterium sp. WL120]TXM70423.1 sigma-70 family RNA polymerase sigma factor [Methylobacterium sp. WL120]